ncbi:MAG: succinate dehydrogenase assembly factor 2 [Alphaproteobacteria bacterium]|nr:succinate dehydrogenase assembly factor 2 [Alphaproteobacteria bacterium]
MISPETPEKKRKRLIFRSWHRGTREMDLLLGSFADQNVLEFSDKELDEYEALLQHNDPDLYGWITQETPPPSPADSPLMEKLRSHRYQTDPKDRISR